MIIDTEVEIDAVPEEVWSILCDFERYPEWNPFIRTISGELQVGAKLVVRIQPPGGWTMRLRPRVLAAIPNREFRWLGHLFLPGIFDGEHSFQILDLGSTRVKFVHSEKFSGVLVALLKKFLDRDTRRGFELMNSALKERAEGIRAQQPSTI